MIGLKLFNSKMERRIALPLLIAVTLPLFAAAWLAMHVVRDHALDAAAAQLQNTVRNQGALLAGRLATLRQGLQLSGSGLSRVASNYVLGRERLHGVAMPRAVIVDSSAGLVMRVPVGGDSIQALLNTQALFRDPVHLPNAYGCVAIGSQVCHSADPASHLIESYPIPMGEQLVSDVELTLYAIQTREAALGELDTLLSIVPRIMAVVALLIAYGAMLYLRWQFAPVPRLIEAIGQIEGGNYAHRVSIESDDELHSLGEVLNHLSARLESSFSYLSEMSHIDESILSGAALKRIVDRVCLAVWRSFGADLVVAAIATDNQLWVRGIQNGEEIEHHVTMSDPLSPDITVRAAALLGRNDCQSVPIRDDSGIVGVLLVGKLDAQSDHRLPEFARKLSVATTHIHRAETLFEQATYDSLTGLYNRRSFEEHLSRNVKEVARRNAAGLLLFIDLDHFKQVNDTQGHAAGDELLKAVAQRLLGVVRETDLVARLGGDEFGVVSEGYRDDADLIVFLDRLIRVFDAPVVLNGLEQGIQVSVGVTLFPRDGKDSATLLKNADAAMYRAKKRDGSCYVFWEHTPEETSVLRAG